MVFINKDVHQLPLVPLLEQLDVKTLVIFRALQLGDMLCAVPALRALRHALPDTHITLVGLPWAEQFVRRFHAYLDEFIAFPGHPAFPEQPVREEQLPAFYEAMQKRKFDLALQMHGSGQISNLIVEDFAAQATAGYVAKEKTGFDPSRFLHYQEAGPEPVRLLQLVEFLGARPLGTHLEFPITKEDLDELNNSGVAAEAEPGRYICIHPGARHRDKCWSPARFAEVADQLADEFGLAVVLTGSAKEADLTAAVASHMRNKPLNAAAPISIGAMSALMGRSRLLVCNDTGVSHIAAGLNLPSVVIFSKADIQRWSPLNQDLHRCIWDPEGKKAALVLEQARQLLQKPQ